MTVKQKKTNRPRVGIFMPAYNQGEYIHEAIESLKQQTFQDFEVAIVDDVSTDGTTIDILRKVKYSKAKVYLGVKNQGVGKLARGYYKSLGNEYIFVLCADDKIAPTFIEECVNYLDNNPGVGAAATYIQNFGEMSGVIELDIEKATIPQLLVNNHFLGSSLMRYTALASIDFGNKQKAFQKHNDYDRWVSMVENGWALGVVEKPLFFYRRLSTSLSSTIDVDAEITFRDAFINKHSELFSEHHKFVIMELYGRVFQMQKWQDELSDGKDWLEQQYLSQNEEIELLQQQNTKLINQNKYSLYPIIRFIRAYILRKGA